MNDFITIPVPSAAAAAAAAGDDVKEVVSSSGRMGDDDNENNGREVTSPPPPPAPAAAASARSGLLPPVIQPPVPIGTTIRSRSGLLVGKKIKTSSTTTTYDNNTISDAGTQAVVVERYVHFIYNGRDIDGKDNMVGNTPLMDALNKSYDPTRCSFSRKSSVDSGLYNTGEPDHTGIFLLLEVLPGCYNNSTRNKTKKKKIELVDIEARNMYGQSPLDFAALIAIDIGVVKLLIQKGVDVNAKVDDLGHQLYRRDELEMTILHKACMYYQNRTDIIEVLLEIGKADIESKDYNGNTPLHLASCSKVAANRNNPNIVKLLIEKGANVHATNDFGETPLYKAMALPKKLSQQVYVLKPGEHIVNNQDVIKTLIIDGCADVNCTPNDEIQMTPLHHACWNKREGRTEIVKLLLIHGGKSQLEAKELINGQTPLHVAVRTTLEKLDEEDPTYLDVIKLLVEDYNANLHCVDHDGNKPIHYALEYLNRMTLFKYLIEMGKIELDDGSNVVDIDDVYFDDDTGRTILHEACKIGNFPCVEYLTINGADPKRKDHLGNQPLDYAEEIGHDEIVRLLNEYEDFPRTDTEIELFLTLHQSSFHCWNSDLSL